MIDNPNYPVTNEHKRNCCSVECCRVDLKQKLDHAYDLEKRVGMDEAGEIVSKQTPRQAAASLRRAADQHFCGCLECYNIEGGVYIITNEDRIRLQKRLYDPQPPPVPLRLDFVGIKNTYLGE